MQTLTTTQLDWLKRGGLIGYNITVTPLSGSPFTITEDDIIDSSLVLDRSQWSSSQAVEIGNADAAELKFVLDNADGRWNSVMIEGATMVLSFDINGEALAGGKFIADRPVKGGQTVSVSALDYMVKFNKLYDGNLTYPATLLQILTDCATDCGVTLDTTLSSFTNSSYSVTSAPIEAGLTYHQIVAWVAQLAGGNAWMDWDGELRISWYGDTNAEGFDITADMLFQDADHGESEVQITGVEYVQEDTSYSAGTTGYVFRFKDNPLLQANISTVLANISAKVTVHKFLPYSNLPTVFLPNLWPGDIVIADAVSFVPSDDSAEITAIASGADIAKITNGAGIDGAGFVAKTYFKAGVLIGRHRMGTRSDMVGVGETATVLGYAPQTGLSDAMRNSVKAIATTKVETLAIERTLTVGASTVVVRIDDTNGISITKDGVKVFGIDTDGEVFASSISNIDDSDYYMTYGYDGSPGIECFMPTVGKWLGISPTVSGGISIFDKDANRRMEFYANGSFTIKDSNIVRLFIDEAGAFAVYDASGVLRIEAASTRSTIQSPNGNNTIGVDDTGVFKDIGGTITYL